MGLIAGIRLLELNDERAVSHVPFKWWNKNPFNSMYFAVQSMAAELSTAALAMLALRGVDYKAVLIIVDMKAEFVRKAKSKITFSCLDYDAFKNGLDTLQNKDDAVSITAKTVGRDETGEEVAVFYFTWSFKRR